MKLLEFICRKSVKRSVNIQRSSIPNHVLNSVCQETDGYLIFYMGKDGDAEYSSGFINRIYFRGLLSYALEEVDKLNKDNKTELKSRLIAQLEEHTMGGFIFFYIDLKGEAQYIFKSDSSIIGKGLISFAKDVLKGEQYKSKSEYCRLMGFLDIDDLEDDDDSEF